MKSKAEKFIFFDESGKKEDYPILMGGVSIPKRIYNRDDLNSMMGKKVHWVDFKNKRLIKELIDIVSKYEEVIKVNIINYDYMAIESAATEFYGVTNRKEFIKRTLYAKFPERIFYGLLRKSVKHVNIEADIIIEQATEYQEYVKDLVEKHLNIQALYRSENFTINSCCQKAKGTEIGLEITDLILGIVRFIIKNDFREASNRLCKKTKFVIEILKNPFTYNLFSKRIMFFEWNKNELKEVDFNKYLQEFIVSNEDIWFDIS